MKALSVVFFCAGLRSVGSISATRREPDSAITVHETRRFRRLGSCIKVLDKESRSVLRARVGLVGDSNCMIEVMGQDYPPVRLWRFIRLVLEASFFGGR